MQTFRYKKMIIREFFRLPNTKIAEKYSRIKICAAESQYQ